MILGGKSKVMNLTVIEALRLTNIDFLWTNLTNFSAVDDSNGTYRQDIIDNKVSTKQVIPTDVTCSLGQAQILFDTID